MDSWSCGDELPPDAAGMRERARMSAFEHTDTRVTGFLEKFDSGSGWCLHGSRPCLLKCVLTAAERNRKFRRHTRLSQPPGIVLEMRTNPRPYCQGLRWGRQLIER
jgi:hypothetical protein